MRQGPIPSLLNGRRQHGVYGFIWHLYSWYITQQLLLFCFGPSFTRLSHPNFISYGRCVGRCNHGDPEERPYQTICIRDRPQLRHLWSNISQYVPLILRLLFIPTDITIVVRQTFAKHQRSKNPKFGLKDSQTRDLDDLTSSVLAGATTGGLLSAVYRKYRFKGSVLAFLRR